MNNFTEELISIYWDFSLVILTLMLHGDKTNHSELVKVIPYDDEEILLKVQEDDEEILLKVQEDNEEILLKAQEDNEEILLESNAWYRAQAIIVKKR